tara:strand:- start:279 stop:842 length:564 start_codon:yes stop_codon:yes gene_type:complete
MNEELMTTGSTPGAAGFSNNAAAKGPVAGYDPVMKFRKKLQKRKKTINPFPVKEGLEMNNRLFQYKVSMPEVGDTIVYANSPAELRQKLRLLVNYRYRGDIKIERIMPAAAGKFFMDKRSKHLKNEEVVHEVTDQKQMQNQLTRQKHTLEKKKANLKIQTIRKQLQKKTQQLKAKGRVGGNTQDYNK